MRQYRQRHLANHLCQTSYFDDRLFVKTVHENWQFAQNMVEYITFISVQVFWLHVICLYFLSIVCNLRDCKFVNFSVLTALVKCACGNKLFCVLRVCVWVHTRTYMYLVYVCTDCFSAVALFSDDPVTVKGGNLTMVMLSARGRGAVISDKQHGSEWGVKNEKMEIRMGYPPSHLTGDLGGSPHSKLQLKTNLAHFICHWTHL